LKNVLEAQVRLEVALEIMKRNKSTNSLDIEQVEKAIELLKKETTPAATEVEIKNCIICKENTGQLTLEDNALICETCAQVMSDQGHSLTLE